MKRTLLLTVLFLIFIASAASATPPGCQSACLDYSSQFIIQCFNATGDSSACTAAGSMIYEDCMRNNCPGRPPR